MYFLAFLLLFFKTIPVYSLQNFTRIFVTTANFVAREISRQSNGYRQHFEDDSVDYRHVCLTHRLCIIMRNLSFSSY